MLIVYMLEIYRFSDVENSRCPVSIPLCARLNFEKTMMAQDTQKKLKTKKHPTLLNTNLRNCSCDHAEKTHHTTYVFAVQGFIYGFKSCFNLNHEANEKPFNI